MKSVSQFHFDYGAQEMKYKRSSLADQCFTFIFFQREKSTVAASLGTSAFFHIVGKVTLPNIQADIKLHLNSII